MIYSITVRPNEFKDETRIMVESEKYLPYAGAYIGAYTYCWSTQIDNAIEFQYKTGHVTQCYLVGKFNSIANNLMLVFGKNHNIKSVDTGALSMMLGISKQDSYDKNFNQKGCIIIQNDVWIGENVTIMPNVIVRNGAVVARNSHVVEDVPAYAIVGGNPAKVIGYRYPQSLIPKMQTIQWWYWEDKKIEENKEFFKLDIDKFCDRFYGEAEEKYNRCAEQREMDKDSFFVFVDYYEKYNNFPFILEAFLEEYMLCSDKRLVLFIQEDIKVEKIDNATLVNIQNIIDEIGETEDILCEVELERGNITEAKKKFLQCSHYIITSIIKIK